MYNRDHYKEIGRCWCCFSKGTEPNDTSMLLLPKSIKRTWTLIISSWNSLHALYKTLNWYKSGNIDFVCYPRSLPMLLSWPKIHLGIMLCNMYLNLRVHGQEQKRSTNQRVNIGTSPCRSTAAMSLRSTWNILGKSSLLVSFKEFIDHISLIRSDDAGPICQLCHSNYIKPLQGRHG